MSSATSTITSKWQITIPEEIRSELPLQIGERISWEVHDGKIIGRRVRTVRELAGSLKAIPAKSGLPEPMSVFAQAAIKRHKRLAKP